MHGPLYTIRAAWGGTQIGRPTPAEIQGAFDRVSRAQLLQRLPGTQSNDWGGWYAPQDDVNAPAATIAGPSADGGMVATGQWLFGDTNNARSRAEAMANTVASLVAANLNALHRVDDWTATASLAVSADPPSLYTGTTNGDVLPGDTAGGGRGSVPGTTLTLPAAASGSSSVLPWLLAGGAVVAIAAIALHQKRGAPRAKRSRS